MKTSTKAITHLTTKKLISQKAQNIITIIAIALTTILFTSLFTILSSVVYSFQQTNFKQAGGYNHGEFKGLTKSQYETLKTNKDISEYGLRRILATGSGDVFTKHYTEISYVDQNAANWMYCNPTNGTLPKENTNEAAVDSITLSLLKIPQKIGETFTIKMNVDGTITTQTFKLCGWWTADKVSPSGNIIVSQSCEKGIFKELNTKFDDGMTGRYNLEIMFSNSRNIEEKMTKIVTDAGMQCSNQEKDNYIEISANWSYMSSQLSNTVSWGAVVAVAALLILIICAGYLIIYNIFQISAQRDIRNYGLLKTIGTDKKQIHLMIKIQAAILSVIGIPIGLLLGFLVGYLLVPTIFNSLGQSSDSITISPLIFVVSALFSAATVWLSCRKPAKFAGLVSPIEALRYNETSQNTKAKIKNSTKKIKISKIAFRNLTRNKKKTLLTICSIALSVILFEFVYTFANSFDMDSYIQQLPVDCVVANSSYMDTATAWKDGLSKNVANDLSKNDFVKAGGCAYALSATKKDDEPCDVYAMDKFLGDKTNIVSGDISQVYSDTSNIAIVYYADDYGKPELDSNSYKVGDTVTLKFDNKPTKYKIVASVTVPYSISFRWYGSNQFLISNKSMDKLSCDKPILYYAFDTVSGKEKSANSYISDLTQNKHTELNFESKSTYKEEFSSFKSMFFLLGTALSIIVGLIGIINFINTMITSIITRKYELAVLQAIGMTSKQTKKMLIYEGLYYLLSAQAVAVILSTALSPILSNILNSLLWFIKFKFTLTPILITLPAFVILGIIVPLICYKNIIKQSIIQRLTGKE